ncbi:hypothetical protein Vsou_01390 [Vulcanisaeta souniana JCM 11219]|uniref:Uncharacterized protein n=1 Tax=Vulcanisaeta souniana JCM 11219 TaxID=1293586 RepID=A0ABN6SPX1_9CREN|nr:hypothetical protein Vsou_01390 [Vulcanisaeta souniana JCM 11219]
MLNFASCSISKFKELNTKYCKILIKINDKILQFTLILIT